MKQVTTRKKCLKCNNGELKYLGYALMSNPPQYDHECSSCKNKQTFFFLRYPDSKFEFEEHEKVEVWE